MTIFVSYSWVEGNPDEKVLNLVADLRRNGYEAYLDMKIQ